MSLEDVDASDSVASRTHSSEMLKAVIEGDTYRTVGVRFGVTTSAVERRVKVMVRHLINSVGVEGLTLEQAVRVHSLRRHRADILFSLTRFNLAESIPRSPGRVVSEAELETALRRIAARSKFPCRDQALFQVLFVSGARPLEIARLEVCDYLNPDGSVKRISELRAEAAINGRARPLLFSGGDLDTFLSHYFVERMKRSHGVGMQGLYRGLSPHSRLFLTINGDGFPIFEYGLPGQKRHLCRPILELYRKLFQSSGLEGITPLIVRLTAAARWYQQGANEEQVGVLLGLCNRYAVREQFPRPSHLDEAISGR